MNPESEFFFHSKLFDIDLSEVDETGPYMFGRELATWLAERLKNNGYEIADVVADDWGWTVVIQRGSYSLFVTCFSALNRNLVNRLDGEKPNADILWHLMPGVHQPLLSRLFKKADVEPVFAKLNRDIRMIIDSERSVEFATQEAVDAFERELDEILDEEFGDEVGSKPLPRWITLPVGLLMIPFLLISIVGSASLLYDNPAGYEVIRPIGGTIMLLACGLLAMVSFRLISGRPGRTGGLFSPVALRSCAVLCFVLPIGGFFSGWYVDHPVAGPMQALTYYVISFSLWRLAARRQSNLTSSDGSQDGK